MADGDGGDKFCRRHKQSAGGHRGESIGLHCQTKAGLSKPRKKPFLNVEQGKKDCSGPRHMSAGQWNNGGRSCGVMKLGFPFLAVTACNMFDGVLERTAYQIRVPNSYHETSHECYGVEVYGH